MVGVAESGRLEKMATSRAADIVSNWILMGLSVSVSGVNLLANFTRDHLPSSHFETPLEITVSNLQCKHIQFFGIERERYLLSLAPA